ncbi:unnamed protein product [Clonostachys chloroleuca]|uniref:DOC domain-containing protein n=1 Tax=Clonostachys chloroleuca TaxID=1926264 RepID=A0AA35MHI0_9HYPO|nr:unnamed protein product [Clonostachys chloroleuca]
MSPGGALIGCRTPTHRPLPSADKENQQALREALESQQQYYLFQLQQLARGIEQLQRQYRHTHRILRSSIRISQSQIIANDSAAMPQSRLSMPELSDDSGSEPDLSVLAMTRPGPPGMERLHLPPYDISHDHLQEDDTSLVEGDVDDMEGGDHTEELEGAEGGEEEDVEDEEGDEDEDEDYVPLVDPATLGLKEISNLGKFTVSSHKQGNGVDELRSDDLGQYWQSDGPQPHKLTVYFVKRVGIRDLRFYVNYNEDESYTPTKIIFKSGTSENNLIEFAQMTLETPVGWQQVSLSGAGGDPDGNTLVSYVLQMQILENHQNGKDTHLRGIKIYAFDMDSGQAQGRENNPIADMVEFLDVGGPAAASIAPSAGQDDTSQRLSGLARRLADTRIESGEAGLSIPDFMRDPEIR